MVYKKVNFISVHATTFAGLTRRSAKASAVSTLRAKTLHWAEWIVCSGLRSDQ